MKVKITAATSVGSREENQDALLIPGMEPEQSAAFWKDTVEMDIPSEGIAFSLADGIGSGTASAYMARLAVERFCTAFSESCAVPAKSISVRPPQTLTTEEFPPEEETESSEVLFLSQQTVQAVFPVKKAELPFFCLMQAAAAVKNALNAVHGEGGCTFVGGILTPEGCFRGVSIGDAMAFQFCSGGAKLKLLNRPQNAYYEHLAAGLPAARVEKCRLFAHLGESLPRVEKKAEEFTVELKAGDRLLLCSDGCDLNRTLLNLLLRHRMITAERLVRLAAKLPSADNCTAILIDIL